MIDKPPKGWQDYLCTAIVPDLRDHHAPACGLPAPIRTAPTPAPPYSTTSAPTSVSEPPTPRRSERVLKIAGTVVTLVALLSIAVGLWLYLERSRALNESWSQQDAIWNTDILGRLEAIEKELATQTLTMTEIKDAIEKRDDRATTNAEELELEHETIHAAIYAVAADIAFALGVHEGRHHDIR